MPSTPSLRWLALVSAVYDLALAASLLFFAAPLARACGAPAPQPLVNAQLNGVFTLALGVGYFWALRTPAALRGYLWIFNVLAKGLGALLFLWDRWSQGSPPAFLVFAACDGLLAVLTLAALMRHTPPRAP